MEVQEIVETSQDKLKSALAITIEEAFKRDWEDKPYVGAARKAAESTAEIAMGYCEEVAGVDTSDVFDSLSPKQAREILSNVANHLDFKKENMPDSREKKDVLTDLSRMKNTIKQIDRHLETGVGD